MPARREVNEVKEIKEVTEIEEKTKHSRGASARARKIADD